MSNKKILIIAIVIGLIASNFSSLVRVLADRSQLEDENYFLPPIPSDIEYSLPETKPVEYTGDNKSYSAIILKDQILYEKPQDADSVTSSEVETFFAEGATLKDLNVAENLSHKHFKKIEEIVEDRLTTNKTMQQLDDTYAKEVMEKSLVDAKKKFPKIYKKVLEASVSVSEQAEILAVFQDYQDINLDQFIKDYKAKGAKAVQNIIKTRKINRNPKKETYEKLGLTSVEAQEYSDAMLNQLADVAAEKGVTVKQLITERQNRQKQQKKSVVQTQKGGNANANP